MSLNLWIFVCFHLLILIFFPRVLYPEPPPKPAKKDGKKDAKKDGKKDNKKETKQESKPTKGSEKKPTPVLTNGSQTKKSEKKTILPVQQNGNTATKKTEKGIKVEVKTKTQAQPKSQAQPKTQAQPSKSQPKGKPTAPVVEISIEAAKRIRNLKKKLKTIEELELKIAQSQKIDKDQRVKVSKKAEVLAEIQGLESGKIKV